MSANSTRLRIAGPAPSWGPDAREGELTRSDGKTLPVLVRLLPDQPAQQQALMTLQHQAKNLARCRCEGLLRLINVSAVGGNAALVYVRFEGLSLAQVLHAQRIRGGWLPVKVCLEIAATVAQGVAELTDTVARSTPDHRVIANGPSVDDILIDASGQLRMARVLVSGPGDPPHASLNPGYTPPEGPDSLQANVYGLGALALALLSTQAPPPAHPDLRQHDALIQQSVGNLSLRPGEPVPRAATQLIRLAMSGNPLVRPSTIALAAQLTEIAESMRGPGVSAWAGPSVPRLRSAAMAAPLDVMPELPPAQPPSQPRVQGPPPRHRPLPTIAPPVGRQHVQLQESIDDDPTARQDSLQPLVALDTEPEATQESQLPAGFFDQPTPEASPGGVGMGLFRMVDPPTEDELDPALEPTAMVGQFDSAEEPTVGLTNTGGLQEVTEDPDAKTEALPPELRDALRAAPPRRGPRRPPPRARAAQPFLLDDDPAPAAPARVDPAPAGLGGAEPMWGPGLGAPVGPAPAGPSLGDFGEPSLGSPGLGGYDRMEPGLGDGAPLELDEDEDASPRRSGGRALQLAVIVVLGVLGGVGAVLYFGGGAALKETPAEVAPPPEEPPAPEAAPDGDAAEVSPEAPEAAPEEAPAVKEPPKEPKEAVERAPAPQPSRAPKAEAPKPQPPEEPAEPEEVVPRIRVTPIAQEPPKEPAPTPAPEAPAAEVTAPAQGSFHVTFNSGDPAVTGLTVKCHRGTPNGYTPPVIVLDAEPGPCRVTGKGDDGGLVAFVELTGPATFTCFADGERTCK